MITSAAGEKLLDVAEPLAIWGALTGTASVGFTVWRERWNNKRALRVERGWQYVFHRDADEERLKEVWVSVMAWNTGRRPLNIEHVGFEFLVPGPHELLAHAGIEADPERPVWINARFEIALNGETIEVVPDGPAVKVWTRIQPILARGINPIATPVRSFVVTVPETYWWSSQGSLVARPPQGRSIESMEAELGRLAAEQSDFGAVPLPTIPGQLIGLPRLILEGQVERSSEL